MEDPIDPIKARQARQGRPVLIILVVSLLLALAAAWVLWIAFDEVETTTYLPTNTGSAPSMAQIDVMDGPTIR